MSAVFTDLLTDTLYVARFGEIAAIAGGAPERATWRSKTFVFAENVTFGWCRVRGPIEADVTVNIYADGVLVQTTVVTNRSPFRVKAVRARRWSVEVESTDRIVGITLSQSSEELTA